MNFKDYQLAQYKFKGRGEIENSVMQFDCWGLVRHVRHYVFNRPLLPTLMAVNPESLDSKNDGYLAILSSLIPCEPKQGCMVCVFQNGLFSHCGIMITLDSVIDIDEGRKPRIVKLSTYINSKFGKEIKYYD